MRIFLTFSLFIIALAITQGCGFLIEPWEQNDASQIRWKNLPVEYKISSTIPQEYHEEIHAGFDEWNRTLQQEVFRFTGIKELKEDQLAPAFTVLENVVLATNQSGALYENVGPGKGPLARTAIYGHSAIRDADIYLFEFDLNFVSGRPQTGDVYSIRSIIMHEAGHVLLGPQHSTDQTSVLAQELYPRDHPLEKLGLGADEIARFCATYWNSEENWVC